MVRWSMIETFTTGVQYSQYRHRIDPLRHTGRGELGLCLQVKSDSQQRQVYPTTNCLKGRDLLLNH